MKTIIAVYNSHAEDEDEDYRLYDVNAIHQTICYTHHPIYVAQDLAEKEGEAIHLIILGEDSRDLIVRERWKIKGD